MDRLRAAAERARSNLSRYFSPNIVEMLAAQDEPLGAVRRQTVAVLFVDIVGFTRMAEAMAPEAVMTMLREFHERMTAQIFACGGTVEKYIGDAIFAVFGVPTASADDAANALACAEMMLDALARWNDEREATGEPPLAIGIGLNYGPAVLGDVGSEHSMSFTVIGDTVNTASRLQGLTRTLETPLVVGDGLSSAQRGDLRTAAGAAQPLAGSGGAAPARPDRRGAYLDPEGAPLSPAYCAAWTLGKAISISVPCSRRLLIENSAWLASTSALVSGRPSPAPPLRPACPRG